MNAPFRPPTWSAATQTDPLATAIGVFTWLGIMALVWAVGLRWAFA